MKVEKEITDLAAYALAFNTVIVCTLHSIGRVSPELQAALQAGFNEAADTVENLAIQLGKSADPNHTVKALRIIEEMRAATFGKQKRPT